uniref:Uncharacterized protein n=1 Tax=viral metagenome TaxID=1070528 RepID=A0A6H1ZLV9_9ZZZZ
MEKAKKCHYCGKEVGIEMECLEKGICERCLNISEKFDSFDEFHAYIMDICEYWEEIIKQENFSYFV